MFKIFILYINFFREYVLTNLKKERLKLNLFLLKKSLSMGLKDSKNIIFKNSLKGSLTTSQNSAY